MENGRFSTVALRQDDFVEQLDGRIIRSSRFSLVNELVETLSLLHHEHVLLVLVRHALHEFVHFEVVEQTRLFLVPRGGDHVAPVRVQQAGKAPHKRCADLIGSERARADYAYGTYTPSVRERIAATASVKAFI